MIAGKHGRRAQNGAERQLLERNALRSGRRSRRFKFCHPDHWFHSVFPQLTTNRVQPLFYLGANHERSLSQISCVQSLVLEELASDLLKVAARPGHRGGPLWSPRNA